MKQLEKLFKNKTIGKSAKKIYKLLKGKFYGNIIVIKNPNAKNPTSFWITTSNGTTYSASPRYEDKVLSNGNIEIGGGSKIISFIIWEGDNDKYANHSSTIKCEFTDNNDKYKHIMKKLKKL